MSDLFLEILPPNQRDLWPQLKCVPRHFVLYGGTALALQMGHRKSVDFDFFSSRIIDPLSLYGDIPILENAEVFESSENTLTVLTRPGGVRLSFFGGLKFQVVHKALYANNGTSVASIADIFGNKCAVVQKRAEFKDYFDICSILDSTRFSLVDGLSFANAMYGAAFNPMATLKALAYFDDLERSLPRDKADTLLRAIKAVDVHRIPDCAPRGKIEPAASPDVSAAPHPGM